eukprot:scaffold259889_cov24-Tisochrysis_lutea.AAC.6
MRHASLVQVDAPPRRRCWWRATKRGLRSSPARLVAAAAFAFASASTLAAAELAATASAEAAATAAACVLPPSPIAAPAAAALAASAALAAAAAASSSASSSSERPACFPSVASSTPPACAAAPGMSGTASSTEEKASTSARRDDVGVQLELASEALEEKRSASSFGGRGASMQPSPSLRGPSASVERVRRNPESGSASSTHRVAGATSTSKESTVGAPAGSPNPRERRTALTDKTLPASSCLSSRRRGGPEA